MLNNKPTTEVPSKTPQSSSSRGVFPTRPTLDPRRLDPSRHQGGSQLRAADRGTASSHQGNFDRQRPNAHRPPNQGGPPIRRATMPHHGGSFQRSSQVRTDSQGSDISRQSNVIRQRLGHLNAPNQGVTPNREATRITPGGSIRGGANVHQNYQSRPAGPTVTGRPLFQNSSSTLQELAYLNTVTRNHRPGPAESNQPTSTGQLSIYRPIGDPRRPFQLERPSGTHIISRPPTKEPERQVSSEATRKRLSSGLQENLTRGPSANKKGAIVESSSESDSDDVGDEESDDDFSVGRAFRSTTNYEVEPDFETKKDDQIQSFINCAIKKPSSLIPHGMSSSTSVSRDGQQDLNADGTLPSTSSGKNAGKVAPREDEILEYESESDEPISRSETPELGSDSEYDTDTLYSEPEDQARAVRNRLEWTISTRPGMSQLDAKKRLKIVDARIKEIGGTLRGTNLAPPNREGNFSIRAVASTPATSKSVDSKQAQTKPAPSKPVVARPAVATSASPVQQQNRSGSSSLLSSSISPRTVANSPASSSNSNVSLRKSDRRSSAKTFLIKGKRDDDSSDTDEYDDPSIDEEWKPKNNNSAEKKSCKKRSVQRNRL